MHLAHVAMLTQALWLTSCGVVFYQKLEARNLKVLKMSKFNRTLHGQSATVGESIAFIDWANKSARSEALQACPRAVILDGSTNRADVAQLVADVNDLESATILTVDQDGATGCRETIELWLPITQRLQQGKKPIKIRHICRDIKLTQRDNDSLIWFAYRPIGTENFIHDPENTLARIEPRSALAQFVDQLHYYRTNTLNTPISQDLKGICSLTCRSTCALLFVRQPKDMCKAESRGQLTEALKLITTYTLANVTLRKCSRLTPKQMELLGCDSVVYDEDPGIYAFGAISLMALIVVIFYIRSIYLNRNSGHMERCAAIDGLANQLTYWTRELINQLTIRMLTADQLANNHPLLCNVDRIFRCALNAMSALPVANLIEPLAGTVARSLTALFFVATLTISILQGRDHACDQGRVEDKLAWLEHGVAVICLLLAAIVVYKRAVWSEIKKSFWNYMQMNFLKTRLTDLLLSGCRWYQVPAAYIAIILQLVSFVFFLITDPLCEPIRAKAFKLVGSIASRIGRVGCMSRFSRSPVTATSVVPQLEPQLTSDVSQPAGQQMDEPEVDHSNPHTSLPLEAADRTHHERELTISLETPSGSACDNGI